jgi:hypothetical protein
MGGPGSIKERSIMQKDSPKAGMRTDALVAAPQVSPEGRPQVMSASDLARLGGGRIAYIKVMTPAEARAMFPDLTGVPAGATLYALHAADGTPLALTDSRQAAVGHAVGDELEIVSLH